MSSFDTSLALHVAVEAARKAGSIQMKSLKKEHVITKKGEIDLVTEIDVASEKAIIATIKASFPNHSFLAEESGETIEGAEYRWIIDPLDGTTNYAHRFPLFAVSIALEAKGEVIVGVVYLPALDEMFTAVKGEGAFLNEKQISVTNTKELIDSLLATGFAYNLKETTDNNVVHFRNFLMKCQAIRRPGAAAVDLVYTACGIFEGFWELELNPWDIAAGVLIVLEAGGQVSQFSGDPMALNDKNIIASNGLIHQAMVDVLNNFCGNPNILEEEVVMYLAENPEVLVNYPDLYEKLVPQKKKSSGENIINFHHKLVKSLQASNRHLKHELDELFSIARENEVILSHFEAIETSLLNSKSLAELLTTACIELEKRFSPCLADVTVFEDALSLGEEGKFHPAKSSLENIHLGLMKDLDAFPFQFVNNRPVISKDMEQLPLGLFSEREAKITSLISLPLCTEDTVIGVLNIGHGLENNFHEGYGSFFLEMLAGKIGQSVSSLLSKEAVQEEMVRDKLTGLYNKAFFNNILVYEINRAERYSYPLSLMLIDIDDMKKLNDDQGKKTGDELLVSFASLLKGKVRKSDILVRYKGEEFAVVLPHTSTKDALKRAEKLRAAIEKAEFELGNGTVSVTASVGISTYPSEEVTNKKAMIEMADKALYVAKEGGKNKVA